MKVKRKRPSGRPRSRWGEEVGKDRTQKEVRKKLRRSSGKI
jgi:hypothetical protein